MKKQTPLDIKWLDANDNPKGKQNPKPVKKKLRVHSFVIFFSPVLLPLIPNVSSMLFVLFFSHPNISPAKS